MYFFMIRPQQKEAKKKNENAKAGSLADKANLVKRFNEGNK